MHCIQVLHNQTN